MKPLAGLVGRMGLAGEDELHRPLRIVDQRGQPLDVAQDQVGPLVGGEPAGEADRQRVRVEHVAEPLRPPPRARRGGRPAGSRGAARTPAAGSSALSAFPTARRRRRCRSPAQTSGSPHALQPVGAESGGRRAAASAAPASVGTCTPLVMWPIGISLLVRHGPEPGPHRAATRRRAAPTRRWRGATASAPAPSCRTSRADCADSTRPRPISCSRAIPSCVAQRAQVLFDQIRRRSGRGRPAPACAW